MVAGLLAEEVHGQGIEGLKAHEGCQSAEIGKLFDVKVKMQMFNVISRLLEALNRRLKLPASKAVE